MQVLEGIKVVDLSTAYSAPIATMQLADFGAEVIKIENTAGGDGSRSWNPSVNGQGIHFLYMNRNKKSVALNLKSPEGKRILFELVKDADIVVENFRPGVTRKLGIDYEAMRAVKPDIIMASLSGYGQTGPYATRGAYSNLAEALSGLMYVTGLARAGGQTHRPPAWPSATVWPACSSPRASCTPSTTGSAPARASTSTYPWWTPWWPCSSTASSSAP